MPQDGHDTGSETNPNFKAESESDSSDDDPLINTLLLVGFWIKIQFQYQGNTQ